MTLPKGFRSKVAAEVARMRAELGLDDLDVVDLDAIATLVGVRVIDGGELVGRELFEDLNLVQDGVFSAATFYVGDRKFIVTNPIAIEGRRRSDIAHELGHILLGHQLTEIRRIGDVPFRTCRPAEEELATAYAGILLLPKPTLLAEVDAGYGTSEKLSRRQKVTPEMARYRLNTSGVLKRN